MMDLGIKCYYIPIFLSMWAVFWMNYFVGINKLMWVRFSCLLKVPRWVTFSWLAMLAKNLGYPIESLNTERVIGFLVVLCIIRDFLDMCIEKSSPHVTRRMFFDALESFRTWKWVQNADFEVSLLQSRLNIFRSFRQKVHKL